MLVAVVGGSDADIEAARRCLALDPSLEVSLSYTPPSSAPRDPVQQAAHH